MPVVSPFDVGRSARAFPGRSFHAGPPGHNGVESKAWAPVPVTSSMILGSGNVLANNAFTCRLNVCNAI